MRWETLRDPINNLPLALSERTPLSRKPVTAALSSIELLQHMALRTVLMIANPLNLATYNLASINVAAEVAHVGKIFAGLAVTLLARHPKAAGPARLSMIEAALRDGAHILYLVCHGSVVDGTHYLWLEDEVGCAERVSAASFVQAITRRDLRPLLVVLCACHGAGDGYDATLFALGPQLAAAGVPAVFAFQGTVYMTTVARLIPPLLRELVNGDGVIDRGLAAARGALPPNEWWQAVLWLGTHDGRLWKFGEAPLPATSEDKAAPEVDPTVALQLAIATWRERLSQLALQSTTSSAKPTLATEITAAARMVETLEAASRTITPVQT